MKSRYYFFISNLYGIEKDEKLTIQWIVRKLFNCVKKFRIGNPVPGMNDESLYGKSFDDPTAIPVTSKLYRMVMNAGAQHLDYFKDGSFTGAVFIYERGTIKGFAKEENGNPVNIKSDGVDFSDLSKGQSLLTKGIIILLFIDYWATENQRNKIVAKQNYARVKLGEKKKEMYNPDNIFINNHKNSLGDIPENKQEKVLAKIDEIKWYKKIGSRIKNFFRK